MLIIVMHNNRKYLEILSALMRREKVDDLAIIEKKKIGTRLIGMQSSIIFHKGSLLNAYDKALVAVVKGEQKTKELMELVESDSTLIFQNMEDKGFICSVPFHYISDIKSDKISKKEEESIMKVTDYLRETQMDLNLTASSKEDAIKKLGVLLKDANAVSDYEGFIKDVFERESLNTTGIGHYIAIPHARTDTVKDFVIAFGRVADGLEFESLDKKPVKLIFLMGTPKEKKGLNGYLQILSSLTRRLDKESFREELLNASTPKEIIDIFKKVEH